MELGGVNVPEPPTGVVTATIDELAVPGVNRLQAEVKIGAGTYLSAITRFFVRRTLS